MTYHSSPFFNNLDFVNKMIGNIARLGIEIEKIYDGAPQDIEGVVYKDQFYVVQTRPQV